MANAQPGFRFDGADAIRFLSYVQVGPGCWQWTGARRREGYGVFSTNAGSRSAHRVSFELFMRPLLPGEVVCHACDNPACVHPDHLFAGTQLDNIADAVAKGRMATGRRNGWVTSPEAMRRKRKRVTTPPDVVAAIRERAASGETRAALAREYDLHISTVSRLVNERRQRPEPKATKEEEAA